MLFTDAPKQMKSFQECRHTQRAGETGSLHLVNVRTKRHSCSFWRDAKDAEPGPISVQGLVLCSYVTYGKYADGEVAIELHTITT